MIFRNISRKPLGWILNITFMNIHEFLNCFFFFSLLPCLAVIFPIDLMICDQKTLLSCIILLKANSFGFCSVHKIYLTIELGRGNKQKIISPLFLPSLFYLAF